MRIAVVGAGYVGLVSGACLAETGNHVVCVDRDEERIVGIVEGRLPVHEPDLDRLVRENRDAGRLEFTTDLPAAVGPAQVVFIAVGTPPSTHGAADLSDVEAVAQAVGAAMDGPKVVVVKSTVPVGTGARVERILAGATRHPFAVLSNPEFLKQGAAVADFMKPDRVIVGGADDEAVDVLRRLYAPYMRRGDRLLVMDRESAELTKYASNCMLATRISFMNEIARLCDAVGADVEQVRLGLAADTRIGSHYLFPGAGFGGSCLPKDLDALVAAGAEAGVDMRLLRAVGEVNRAQKRRLLDLVRRHFEGGLDGRAFAVWGLAFKAGTDDLRAAPSLDVIEGLLGAGATVRAHDPVAQQAAAARFGSRVELADDPYEMLAGADGLLLLTEWNAYRAPDFRRIHGALKTPVVFDGRNVWDRAAAEAAGLVYHGIGR